MATESDLKEEIHGLLQQIVSETISEKAEVKEEQTDAVFHLFQGRDVTIVLPTSYGKSLCMMAIPTMHKFLTGVVKHQLKNTPNPQVIIVTPLVSLMQSHAESARSNGLKAVHLPEEEIHKDADILLASPEFWTGKEGLKIINDNRDRIVAVATDEVHVLPRWGYSKDQQLAFRSAFSKLADLRSHLPGVPYMALTATATKDSVKIFQKKLGMRNAYLIMRPPTRDNIKISVQKITNFEFLDNILIEFESKRKEYARTIIYCKTTSDCALIYRMIDMKLSDTSLYAMYFHETLEHKKKDIVTDLMKTNGKIRVVVATNALGMGLNLVDFNKIVHYGVPRTLEDYTQEIGRAGRSGAQAYASLFYKSIQMIGCSDDMKSFVKNNSDCRRSSLLQHFAPTFTNDKIEKCCDICCKEVADISVEKSQLRPVRNVTNEDLDLLKSVLEELEAKTATLSHTFGAPIYSSHLTAAVCNHASYIDGLAYVVEQLPILQGELAVAIYTAFCEVFDETPDESEIHYAKEAILDRENALDTLFSSVDDLHFEQPIEAVDLEESFDED